MILLMEEILHQLVDRWSIPLFTRFYTSQVVQDFFHQQQYVGHPLYLPWIKVVAGIDANTEQTGIIPACTELKACWGDSPTIQKPTNHHFSPGPLLNHHFQCQLWSPTMSGLLQKNRRNLPGCTPKKKVHPKFGGPKLSFLAKNCQLNMYLDSFQACVTRELTSPDGASDPTTTDFMPQITLRTCNENWQLVPQTALQPTS